MKKLLEVHKRPEKHWVGDGFPVRSLFSYHSFGPNISPFLLLDYAEPATFPPSETPRGVDEHPHRGFETVTIVYQGALDHGDSAGNHGKIGPGDVQWMTAGSGVVHEEKHSREFTESGGTFEVIQLWVNLPAEHKKAAPAYQTLKAEDIPTVDLGDGTARVIAGELSGVKGPAKTFTPVNVWDSRLKSGGSIEAPVTSGHNALVVVLSGEVTLDGERIASGEVAVLDRESSGVKITATDDSKVLILSGEPIDEPIAGYGPFVMNSQSEIWQAISDYRSGQMGRIAA